MWECRHRAREGQGHFLLASLILSFTRCSRPVEHRGEKLVLERSFCLRRIGAATPVAPAISTCLPGVHPSSPPVESLGHLPAARGCRLASSGSG